MSIFLLELLSEEIPARMQAKARDDLARLFATELAKAGLSAGAIETFATPRRIALIARGLPAETAAVKEEIKGPRAAAPPQALDGFLRKTGLTREQLQDRDGVLFAVIDRPGRATTDVLAEAIPAIVRGFPWPKSMRWGAASLSSESIRWVRPLHGLIALLDEAVVPVEIAGIASGRTTAGHRFHHPAPVSIASAHAYVEALRAAHVIVSAEERQALIRDRAAALAAEVGLSIVPDDGLVAENAGLTEWPVPLIGRFDPDYLSVPREVIQLTLRTNQKYFVCADAAGDLAPAFVCVANIEAADGGAKIVDGNRRVLAARLSDARFFWDQDIKVPLAEQADKLKHIVFHEKLGTVADKVDRVAKLARWLVEEGIVTENTLSLEGEGRVRVSDASEPGSQTPDTLTQPASGEEGPRPSSDRAGHDRPDAPSREMAHLADLADRAARLCKADLVTQMVGEFPELQGVMGGHYARAQGEDPQVADAIRDHYKPVGQGDEVPTAPVTVAVSLADKLDTIVSFFVIKERPTGSRDPFALRRAVLGVIELILRNRLRLEIDYATVKASSYLQRQRETGNYDDDAAWMQAHRAAELFRAVPDFFVDRLKVQQREGGIRHDLIDAVFMLDVRTDDILLNLARVHALQAFVATENGASLLAGYKRAANILKKEGWETPLPPAGGDGGGPAATASEAESPPPTPPASGKGAEGLSYTPEKAEEALIAALDAAEPRARAAVEAERFEDAMAVLATLRAPIDAFFDGVTVNDPDPAKRAARLDLLARVRDAVHRVADFSKIEG